MCNNQLSKTNLFFPRYIPKSDYPPNVLQARPIEKLWAILSRLVYNKGWEAQNHRQLIGRIKRKLNEIDVQVVQSMIHSVKSKSRKIEDNGSLSLL